VIEESELEHRTIASGARASEINLEDCAMCMQFDGERKGGVILPMNPDHFCGARRHMDAHIEALQFAQHLLHVLRVAEPVREGDVVPNVDKIAQVIEETRGPLLGLVGDLIVAMEEVSF
jgi:hypothetical protein